MRVGYNITIKTYIEYDVKEDSEANGKTPQQLIAEVKAMSKGDILDVLENVREISVTDEWADDVTTEYYEIDDSNDETEYEQHAHEGY